MRKLIRHTALRAANTSAFGTALKMFEMATTAKGGVLAVVTYHRVDHADRTPLLYPGLISATPQQFGDQLDMLESVAQVVSMQQVVEACRGESELPAKSVLITFDDACCDFAEFAWPALQSRKMPVTLFVPTAYPDQSGRQFWWDRLYVALYHSISTHLDTPCGRFELGSKDQRDRAFRMLRDHVKQLRHESAMELIDEIVSRQRVPDPPPSVLSWEQLRKLAGQGVTLAPHTQTHPLLTRISVEQARAEVAGSRDDLKREIGEVLPVFAYPGGECNPQVADMMQEEAVELAFTVRRGLNDLDRASFLMLDRINVGQRTTAQVLRAQLDAGWWKHRG